MIRKMLTILLALLIVLQLFPVVHGEENLADEITGITEYTGTGYDSMAFLHDGSIKSYKSSAGSASITLSCDTGMGGLYLMFDLEYGQYTIRDSENQITAGQNSMLHEFVDLYAAFGYAPNSVTIDFSNGRVRLSEIRVFTPGTPPEDVQLWNAPLEGQTDLLLLATHGDDDQLFFAGLLPYYAGELGVNVQVAYLTDHRNLTNARTHEMLNGLWAVGVTAYPVFGEFADFRIDSLKGTYDEYARLGTTKNELLQFVVEQLRRFKPLTVVGHDVNGEYGHGMHMVYADLLMQAVDISADEAQFPELAQQYGLWDVPKTYLHLYETDPIVLDYDTPLESFDGLTAFQVTQKFGYPCHESQQYTWFTGWINGKTAPITKATEIATYNPCNFGLFRSTVGADVEKNDFLENIITYAEQERLEQERLEQERLEQERLEQERLEQERLELERLEQEKNNQQSPVQNSSGNKPSSQLKEQKLLIAVALLIVLLIALVAVVRKMLMRRR